MPNRWTFVMTLQAFSHMSPFLSCRLILLAYAATVSNSNALIHYLAAENFFVFNSRFRTSTQNNFLSVRQSNGFMFALLANKPTNGHFIILCGYFNQTTQLWSKTANKPCSVFSWLLLCAAHDCLVDVLSRENDVNASDNSAFKASIPVQPFGFSFQHLHAISSKIAFSSY